MVNMREERLYVIAVVGYTALSFFLISIVHTIYIHIRFGGAVLGLPFTGPRVTVPAYYTIPGDFFLPVIAFVFLYKLWTSHPVPSEIDRYSAIILAPKYIVLGISLLLIAQIISAASWSKFALQTLVLILMTYLMSLPVERPKIRSTILFIFQ